ncbi:hypothetical protein SOASR015_29850 [Pectobacterium carotovorum subsp. carotovorum]|nr:hypothetical protein SOASR015_29850 [Pectobacterium carotovorum subsp. carotovorum]GLX56050.1 hypothetical protein Pcaca02_13590 [Pectobacterium carotovorum subsp. carotovorum]
MNAVIFFGGKTPLNEEGIGELYYESAPNSDEGGGSEKVLKRDVTKRETLLKTIAISASGYTSWLARVPEPDL